MGCDGLRWIAIYAHEMGISSTIDLCAQCVHDERAGETIQCRQQGQKSVPAVQSGRRFYFVHFRKGGDFARRPRMTAQNPDRIFPLCAESDNSNSDRRHDLLASCDLMVGCRRQLTYVPLMFHSISRRFILVQKLQRVGVFLDRGRQCLIDIELPLGIGLDRPC
jgi:hypothetical protein